MNKYKLILAFSFWFLLTAVACNRDDINFESPTQLLRFSKDTVFCDTVYNQVRSETYAVKVYNDEDKDVLIPKIEIETGNSSLYRINVDGKSGTTFTDVPLRKKDSLFIFVEIAPVANAPEAIAEDRINFQTPAGNQHITLFSVVQDAEFFVQTETNPNILSSNTTWSNNKAKIIFGDLTLAENQTLDIEKGTKVYFFKNSGLKISKNATLNVNGELGQEVTFRGDRNDPRYDTIPKNWNGIYMDENSHLKMDYAKVFGGTRGLTLNKVPDAKIDNSIFHTHQEFGIYAINSVVTAKNLVMNNCGEANFGIFGGGNYDITHSTITNYWNLNSALPALGIYASDEYDNGTATVTNPLTLNLKNSIVYNEGDNAIELLKKGSNFNVSANYCLLKYGSDANYNTPNSIKNEDPKFVNYFTQKMNLRVKEDSPAKGKASSSYSVATDIVGVTRTYPATLGAYQ